jgi:hypothetical protein
MQYIYFPTAIARVKKQLFIPPEEKERNKASSSQQQSKGE